MEEVNWKNRLFADGQSLAITNGAFTYIMPGYYVQGVEVTHNIHEGSYMDIHLRSVGPLKSCSAHEVETIFKNANDLTVDDLLKLINARMEERAST